MDDPEAHLNLGVALQAAGDFAQARVHLERAVAIAPKNAYAHGNLGVLLLEVGEIGRAREAFRSARDLAPSFGRFHRYVVEASVGPVDEADIRWMERLIAQVGSAPSDDSINLHFALARAYDSRGACELSLQMLRQANALKRSTFAYDEAETLRVLDAIPKMFEKPLIEAMSGSGVESSLPIFVFGMPRSGTTLVEQVLAAHPEVHAAGELEAFEHAMQGFSQIDVDPKNVGAFMSELGGRLRAVGARYVEDLGKLSKGETRVTDKNPFNFRFAGMIHLALPNAHMIHVRRNPIDTCFSCFTQLFNEQLPFMYDLGELGRFYRAYERLMGRWRELLPSTSILEVEYEQLVDDFELQAKRIVDFCGLSWNDACLEFSSVKRVVRTASAAAVRQPLYRSAVDRARPYYDYLEPLLHEIRG